MKNGCRILCFFLVLLLMTSCGSAQSSEEHNGDIENKHYVYTEETTDNITFTSFTETECTEENSTTDTLIGNESTVTSQTEKNDIFSADFFQFDLNFDGVPEDFFIGDDFYEIVMYNTYRHPDGYESFSLPRVDSIDIYRRPYNLNPNEFAYWFSCAYTSDKCIHFALNYTGCEEDKWINGYYSYVQKLAPVISYHQYNITALREEFEKIMTDSRSYFEPEWEYVQTLNLEEAANGNCTQHFLQNIKINDDIGEIQIYSLENDVFGKKFKLANGKYSVYASDFDSIEVYERTATMAVPTLEYHVYDYVPREQKDYLICLRSSDSESSECVYLGTADEKYLFFYNFICNYGFPSHGFFAVNAESLRKDGWEYVRTMPFSGAEAE